jgi:hypothetical protein
LLTATFFEAQSVVVNEFPDHATIDLEAARGESGVKPAQAESFAFVRSGNPSRRSTPWLSACRGHVVLANVAKLCSMMQRPDAYFGMDVSRSDAKVLA